MSTVISSTLHLGANSHLKQAISNTASMGVRIWLSIASERLTLMEPSGVRYAPNTIRTYAGPSALWDYSVVICADLAMASLARRRASSSTGSVLTKSSGLVLTNTSGSIPLPENMTPLTSIACHDGR